MKKIYNFLLTILIIIAVIVGTMLIIKYGRNYINEKRLKEVVSKIEEQIKTAHDINQIENTYKGYIIDGIIEIPKIDIKYPIINDTTDEAMKISVTKFWGPDQLNQIGNLSIAGHNNRDGTMFGKTKYLEINDIIKITDLNNCTVEYKIFKIYTVDPNDVSYVDSVDETAREVTLITCTKGHEERLIIKAREIK